MKTFIKIYGLFICLLAAWASCATVLCIIGLSSLTTLALSWGALVLAFGGPAAVFFFTHLRDMLRERRLNKARRRDRARAIAETLKRYEDEENNLFV